MSDLENDTGAVASESDSLRSALEGAFETPTPDTSAPVETAEQASARIRDEKGRFAPKAGDEPTGEAQKPDATQQTTETANAATRKPPASWKKEWHEHWSSLSPAHQDLILEREKDVDRGFQERAAKYKPYEEFDRVTEPHREKFARLGMNAPQAFEKLLAAQDFLDRDPQAAIRWLAQSYRVDLAQLATQPAAPPPQPTYADLVRAAQQEARQTVQRTFQEQQLASIVDQFARNPANIHYETVKADMGFLLQNDKAQTLEDAYEKACRLNGLSPTPEPVSTAPAVNSAQQVAKAKAAAVSVKGAPTGGPAPGAPKATIRDELEAHWR